jgi:DNA polymerase III delta prime subunit
MMFSFFSMQINCFVADGQHFYSYTHEFTISEFKGLKKLKDLPIRLLDEETKENLTRRGRVFRDLGLGAHYKHYKGNLTRASWFGPSYFKSDGRVMVDGGSFRRMNPNYANDVFRSGSRNNSSEQIDDSQLWMTWPSVLGFSFSAKKWGELVIEELTDINFDDHAFDRLVLAPEKKQMVKALVENQRGTFADIITGKGGGCIFLLHGSPGVGKTLTAEAIAELLHRPLYSVSVGELGTSTDVLEERLREILEVASTWNAVVLLDEADIFLEKRTEHDIKRNAMVGIFLRLLEYHQGVMFLTTNRVRSFDPAFHSRISVALKYRDLDEEARKQIWANFLEVTGIDAAELNLNDLAKYDINGRQIKTAVRLAQALAKSESKPVNKDHILRTLGITEQFKKDMLRASANDLY